MFVPIRINALVAELGDAKGSVSGLDAEKAVLLARIAELEVSGRCNQGVSQRDQGDSSLGLGHLPWTSRPVGSTSRSGLFQRGAPCIP